jgi:hypothetical protein
MIIMSIIKIRYLEFIANFNQKQLLLEARHLGVYLHAKTDRQLILKRFTQINESIIGDRLSQLEGKNSMVKPNLTVGLSAKALVKPFVSK